MKLSALRPCDACGGPLGLVFGVVRCSLAVVAPTAARQVLGVATILGARGLGIAEALAPDPDGAVVVTGDHDATLRTELLLCQTCYQTTPLTLGPLIDQHTAAPAVGEGSRGSD